MRERKKRIYKRWWFWLIIIGIVLAVAGSLGIKRNTDKVPESSEDMKITYDNFISIKLGSSYEDVADLLGEGEKKNTSEVVGTKTVTYTWKGEELSSITVTVQNDLVTVKTQTGLGDSKNNVSKEQYDELQEGMSYEAVTSVIGKGVLLSQSRIMNSVAEKYIWTNKDMSVVTLNFTDGVLSTKTQEETK